MIEAKVHSLAITDKGFVVMLKPINSERVIPIFIDYLQAQSMATALFNYKMGRPLTHDLINSIFQKCNIRLVNIIIDNVHLDTYYSKLVIEHNGKNEFVDARPSDAIALALRFQVSIFVEEHVIEKAGMIIEDNGSKELEMKSGIPYNYQVFDKEANSENKRKDIKLNNENGAKTKEEIQKLLEQAVKEERYEDAAKYRDELNNLNNLEN
ncbi:bifunctional nuclease family protein [uncultured Brachyspira sp.]|uniref:bifunctional nuclease family protein n=1 Tax=uncultured Brachyspira sp. TaxID=221953 RepID=UPI0027DC4484|nr:bifunctional nuclease family protein [uncultured Brachyspira sp.]